MLFVRLGLLIFSFTLCTALNCKHFQDKEGGPVMPFGVCLRYSVFSDGSFYQASFKYKCTSLFEAIYIQFYDDEVCGKETDVSDALLCGDGAHCQCSGAVCSHAIVRGYNHWESDRRHACSNNGTFGYIEEAFVTGCWDSSFADISWSLSCSHSTLSLKYYPEPQCDGKVFNVSTIGNGCEWFFRWNPNITIPIPPLNTTIHVNYFDNNNTYFDIESCHGRKKAAVPTWMVVVKVVFVILCCACCLGICMYCCRRFKRQKRQHTLLHNDGEGQVQGYTN